MLMLVCILQGASFMAFAVDEKEKKEEEAVTEELVEDAVDVETGRDIGNDSEEGSGSDDDEDAEEKEPEAAIVNDGSAELVFADESILEYCQYIYFSYLETGAVLNSWSFPYSDRFFEIPSSEFSIKMAQGSLGLAVSAFRSKRFDLQYETYLHQAGFYNLYSFGYDRPTTEDSLSGVIGMKEVNGRTVIAAVTCGQGYKKEWAGNMKVGKGVRHQGFSSGAEKLEGHIAKFIEENNIEGSKVLWVTGMSRAAAIANLTAADAIESGEYDDVYAYLFGVPRTTKEPVKYSGIYNICGQYDAVPAIPLQSWGYERYGIDLYTPSQEADDLYTVYALSANDVGNNLDGKGFRNNPEINYQLRLIIEYTNELFGSSDEYVDRMQDIMIKAVNRHDNEEIMEILTESFRALKPENKREQKSITTFVNYLSFIAAQHMRADQRQVDDGSWDPTESLNSNLMLEHRPSTYVKWMFCDCLPEEKIASPIESRRVTINGKVKVTVYEGGFALTEVGEDGKIYCPDPDLPEEISGQNSIFAMRNGDETVVSLPYDQEYEIEISSDGIRDVNYLDVVVTPEKLVPKKVTIHFGMLRNGGTIRLKSVPGKPLSEPETVKGSYFSQREAEYRYSPTVIMNNELQATKNAYLSLSGAISIVRAVVVLMLVLFVVCLIISRRHRRKIKKEGHERYSDLYVIVPHLICIAVFAGLTQFAAFYLFTIPMVRTQLATITMLFVTLLAARGAIRSKKPIAILVTALLGLLTYCTRLYYTELTLSSFSTAHMLVFFMLIIFVTGVAVWTFDPKISPAMKTPAEAILEKAAETSAESKTETAPEAKEETPTEEKTEESSDIPDKQD